jgi:hypothetical protein
MTTNGTNHHNVVDPAFSVVSKDTSAFIIWRVEVLPLMKIEFSIDDNCFIFSLLGFEACAVT